MKRIKLSVPAMQSEHCQNRVKKNVELLKELKISTLQPGYLSIDVPDDYMIKNIHLAIESTGYQIMRTESELVQEPEAEKKENIKRTLHFTSNIKCMGCVESVAPAFNESEKIDGWHVDLNSTNKILTIESNTITEEEVQNIVQSKGFKAEPIKK